jgi:MFS family permease
MICHAPVHPVSVPRFLASLVGMLKPAGWAWVYLAFTLLPAVFLLMAAGMHPWAAALVAFGALGILTVAGAIVRRRFSPNGKLTKVLSEAAGTYVGFTIVAAVFGLAVWLSVVLDIHSALAFGIAVLPAIAIGIALHRWVVPKLPAWFTLSEEGSKRARRRAGVPETDHPVSIIEGDPGEGPQSLFLVAICDEEGCGWMEFAKAEDLAGQERELRAIAAKHTTLPVGEVKRSG